MDQSQRRQILLPEHVSGVQAILTLLQLESRDDSGEERHKTTFGLQPAAETLVSQRQPKLNIELLVLELLQHSKRVSNGSQHQ